jgi:hypothetical protein
MAVDAREEVWIGHSNITEFVVADSDGPVTDLSAFTRAVFCIGGTEVDSDVEGSLVIWWTDSVGSKFVQGVGTYSGQVVRARLGEVLTEAGEFPKSRLIMYSPDYAEGLVISDDIFFRVWDTCGA